MNTSFQSHNIFLFSIYKKGFQHRVIIIISFSRHRLNNAMFFKCIPKIVMFLIRGAINQERLVNFLKAFNSIRELCSKLGLNTKSKEAISLIFISKIDNK